VFLLEDTVLRDPKSGTNFVCFSKPRYSFSTLPQCLVGPFEYGFLAPDQQNTPGEKFKQATEH